MKPDLIVWPEASTPYALNKDAAWVEELVKTGVYPPFDRSSPQGRGIDL